MRHIRLAMGILVVTLAAAMVSGCVPTAAFTVDIDEGGAPLTVEFTDGSATLIPFLGNATALVPIRDWLWDFGDGVFSEQANPTHTYTAQGTYTVSLTVTNRFGTDTETKQNTIKVTGNANGARANFTAAPVSGVAPLTVQFTDTTQANGVTILGYEWDFGDGETSTTQSPSHVFTDPGVFTVTLTVRTVQGATTIAKVNLINVAEEPRGPQANFKENRTQGTAPLTVTFTDLSEPGDAAITRWDWDFGDGETSNAQSPQHIYQNPGTYSVALTVTSPLGSATRLKTNLIRVLAPAR
ncbi:MAG: PKD domain-containing protein [Candidatus Hydrogenedentes bacterium]|nr:PKD domain-containing protein [Candidatus Hydrogenedentota bacterium]